MREITTKELQSVSGGNPLFPALQLASAFQTGYGVGSIIASTINGSFSMTTGEAAYYMFGK